MLKDAGSQHASNHASTGAAIRGHFDVSQVSRDKTLRNHRTASQKTLPQGFAQVVR